MEELNQNPVSQFMNSMDSLAQELQKHCLYPKCNKVLEGRKYKYCSDVCRTRHHALIQYAQVKDDEAFKIKRKEKNRKYYEEHKEKLKADMRVYGMKYFFRKREELRKLEEQKKLQEQSKTTETKD